MARSIDQVLRTTLHGACVCIVVFAHLSSTVAVAQERRPDFTGVSSWGVLRGNGNAWVHAWIGRISNGDTPAARANQHHLRGAQ
jgi:hypothetical protein